MCFNKKYILTFIILFLINFNYSQNRKIIDSLQIEISKKQNFPSLIENYYLLANEFRRFDIEKTIEINQKIWELSKKNNFEKGFAHFFLIKSSILIFTQKYELSRINIRKASDIYLKVKDTIGYLDSQYNLAFALSKLNKSKESLEIIKDAIDFSKSKKYKFQMGKLYYCLGGNYYDNNFLKNSLFYYNKSISFFRESNIDNKLILSSCYSQIAMIYISTKQFDKALEYMKISIKYARNKNQNINEILRLYSILSSIYINIKDYNSANKYIQIVIKKSKLISDKEVLIYNTNLLASINFLQKQYDLSIENSNQSIAISENEEDKIDGTQNLGNCYFAIGQYQKAIEFQKKIINLINKSENKEVDQITYFTIYEEIAKTENALGNYKKAYEYSLLNKEISDKILNEEKTSRINELQTSFEVSEKENALKNSLNEKQKKDIKIQKQNYYITIISAILLSTILLIFLLTRIYLINKKKNKQLLSKNIIIEKTNAELNQSKITLEKLLSEKDVLLKEIHHRVKNNLQLIISLLNIQSRNENSMSTSEFVEKSLARITSMSLVHQNLYQNENIEKVNFNEYLKNLTHSISNSFSEKEDKIVVNIECEEVYFNIETAIPLGLIINELMCNIYKHAFPNSENGKIDISVKKDNNNYQISISDNGIGYDEQKNKSSTMGMKLVNLLSNQINGTFQKIQSDKTEFLIQFVE